MTIRASNRLPEIIVDELEADDQEEQNIDEADDMAAEAIDTAERVPFDGNSFFVGLLRDLSNSSTDMVNIRIFAINNFLNVHAGSFDPMYKAAFRYAHTTRFVVEDFFVMINKLTNVSDVEKNTWLSRVAGLLLTKLHNMENLDRVDTISTTKKLLAYLEDSERLTSVVGRLTEGVYTPAELRNNTFIDALLSEEAIYAKKELGLTTENLLTLRQKFADNDALQDKEQNDENFRTILSNENVDYLKKQRAAGNLVRVINSTWPQDESLHIKLFNSPEFFKTLFHPDIWNYIDNGYGTLDFFVNRSAEELQSLVNRELSEVQNTIQLLSSQPTLLASTQFATSLTDDDMDADMDISVATSSTMVANTINHPPVSGKRKR